MRVALNLEQLLQTPSGGVGRYTAELARLLPRHDIELVPFVARHRRRAVEAALRDVGLAHLDPAVLRWPRPLLYDLWHVFGRPRVDRLGSFDVLHAPSVAVPPKPRAAALVVTVHDAAPILFPETYPRRGRWFHERGIAAAARRADVVITVSQAAADELDEHTDIPPERVRVVPNGVDVTPADDDDVASARRALGIGEERYVLWVGSLEPRKNVDVLVEAFARTELPLLVLAGPRGWLTDDRSAASSNISESRVRRVGHVDDARLRALYRGADVLALPSVHEGFGLPALEAMAQGTPVVAADIPALREVTGDSAVLVPPRSVDGWAEALERLVADDAARVRLAESGRDRAQRFSWQRCAERTRDVYAEALASRA